MILAWGLLIASVLVIVIGFADKMNKGEDFREGEGNEMIIAYVVALCSAQYIWG